MTEVLRVKYSKGSCAMFGGVYLRLEALGLTNADADGKIGGSDD